MKKFLSFLLAFVLLSAPLSEFADTPYYPKDAGLDGFLEAFDDVFEKPYPSKDSLSGYDCYYFENKNTENVKGHTYALICFKSDFAENKPFFNRIGDYYEYSEVTNPHFPSGYAVYDYENDIYREWDSEAVPPHWDEHYKFDSSNFLSISEIADNKLLFDAVLECIENNNLQPRLCRVGAFSTKATIKDATNIQKILAQITSFNGDERCLDVDNNGTFNIRDATRLQKSLVCK